MANTPYIDLVKPAGTDKALISVLNANSDKIDSAVGGVQDALAIVCNGNTHGAITSGQYVYVRAHDTLQEGLYTANSNIAANATLSSSNLTANSSGGLNALNEHIANLGDNSISTPANVTSLNLPLYGTWPVRVQTLTDADPSWTNDAFGYVCRVGDAMYDFVLTSVSGTTWKQHLFRYNTNGTYSKQTTVIWQ